MTIAAATERLSPVDSPCSIPGMIREKKEAASITPAAKPRNACSARAPGLPVTNSGRAPRTVARPAARLPRKPVRMIELIRHSYGDPVEQC
ncbi:MAG TPA: hypothetical protein VE891_07090 [Allosphingosinicella sp.]|nr:hypothetical protein [Allosphingosinicella sp.]